MQFWENTGASMSKTNENDTKTLQYTDFFPLIDLSNSTAKLTLNDVTISFCTDL